MKSLGPRGCGSRQKGASYLVLPLDPNGVPVETYLFDPPTVINPDETGVSPLGMTTIRDPSTGVVHLLDWIGSKHYPNVADFVEEVKHMGLSRRVSGNFDFSLLTRQSRLLTIHERAYIANWGLYSIREYNELDETFSCPKHHEDHEYRVRPDGATNAPFEMCIRWWWQDIERGEPTGHDDYSVRRKMPSFAYEGVKKPEINTNYKPAIFAAWPIAGIDVIRGGKNDQAAVDKASLGELPVTLEDC